MSQPSNDRRLIISRGRDWGKNGVARLVMS
jgi:hypothetical protein